MKNPCNPGEIVDSFESDLFHQSFETMSAGEFSTKPDMSQEKVTEQHLEERRHATKNESGITLVPEPSDDPRDPLVGDSRGAPYSPRKQADGGGRTGLVGESS